MRGKRIDPQDIVGEKFGKLTVLEYLGRDQKGKGKDHLYKCQCECGKIKTLRRGNLTNGHTVSCGCIRKGKWLIDPLDIVGERFGRLRVVQYLGAEEDFQGRSKHFYECRCDCGNFTKVQRECLVRGQTKSCGCLRKESLSKIGSQCSLDPTDIIGKKFEKLTVEKYLGPRREGRHLMYWYLCRCECGKTKEVERSCLIRGHTKSCGCLQNRVKDTQDIVGQTFGKLTVLEYLGKDDYDPKHPNLYKCRCECGNEVIIRRDNLLYDHSHSCGCAKGHRIDPTDIIGKKFGRLTVKEHLGRTIDGVSGINIYLCQCECGKETRVARSNLISGNTRSCGCLRNNPNAVVKRVPRKRRKTSYPYDIIGTQEGGLICTDCLRQRKDRNWVYLVECEKCGHQFELDRGNFMLGQTQCPNCYKPPAEKPKKKTRPNNRIDPQDIVGKRYGRLTVLEYKGPEGNKKHTYLCRCDCGTEKVIGRNVLLQGRAKSCGCLSRDNARVQSKSFYVNEGFHNKLS